MGIFDYKFKTFGKMVLASHSYRSIFLYSFLILFYDYLPNIISNLKYFEICRTMGISLMQLYSKIYKKFELPKILTSKRGPGTNLP